jgi:hypothetical protein
MKTDAGNSGSSSAGTSPGGPNSESAAPLSEAEFLKREATRAKAAIGEALSDLGNNLKATADPHVLTRDHPWVAISAAAVAGFAAAITLIPSKEQQALRALAELERVRHAPPPAAATSDKAAAAEGAAGGIFATIAAEVFKMIRPLITTLLTAGISRATAASSGPAPADGNGHADHQDGDHPNSDPRDEEIATPS